MQNTKPLREFAIYLQQAQQEKRDFEVVSTKSGLSFKVIDQDGTHQFCDESLSFKFFNTLAQLKAQVQKNAPECKHPKQVLTPLKMETYVHFNQYYAQSTPQAPPEAEYGLQDMEDLRVLEGVYSCPIGQVWRNVVEIDINSAYLMAALKLGYIDDKLFQKINGLKKKERLIILGMIAAVKTTNYYKAGELQDEYSRDYVPKFVQAFKNIVEYVHRCMWAAYQECHKNVLFFWVDAIFLRARNPQELQTIAEVCKKYGFEVKTKANLTYQCLGKYGLIVHPDGKEKMYLLPQELHPKRRPKQWFAVQEWSRAFQKFTQKFNPKFKMRAANPAQLSQDIPF